MSLMLASLGIRNFIVNIIMRISSDEVALRKEKTYLNKLNMVLVQVSATLAVLTSFPDAAADPQAGVAA